MADRARQSTHIEDVDTQAIIVQLAAAARQGLLKFGSVTLDGNVASIAVPTGSKGVIMLSKVNNSFYAVNEDPATSGTAASPGVGGIARAGLERAVMLDPTAVTLRINGTSGTVVEFEFF